MPASFSEIEPYIIQSESHGQNFLSSQNYDYPNSTASGYFQITNSTLRGIPSSITGGATTASDLTFAQQQQAANYLWDTTGGTAWTNWNPQIAAANNAILAGNSPSYQPSSGVLGLIGQNSGDPNISINQAYPDSSGVPSYQNPTTDQNLTNYGYFGQPPASDVIGNELPGTTDTSILNANADQLLSGNYAETPTLSGTTDVGGGLTAVSNPLDNSGNLDPSNAGNYGYFGLPTDAGNSLVTGAANALNGQSADSWWNWAVGVALDFIERFGLIILGLVLIAGAAWALSRESKE